MASVLKKMIDKVILLIKHCNAVVLPGPELAHQLQKLTDFFFSYSHLKNSATVMSSS